MTRYSTLLSALLLAGGILGGCASATTSRAAADGWIRAGETRTGTLSPSDPVQEDESHYDEWAFRGREGERIQVDLRSPDFDAFLAFGMQMDGEAHTLHSDDDGGDGTDSRLTIDLPATGVYVITANSLSGGETGGYTLSVISHGQAPRADLNGPGVKAGQSVQGTLSASDAMIDDGSYADHYIYQGRAGERVRIRMRSADFDAYLGIGMERGGELDMLESDDDGAGGTDAEIEITLGESRPYVIRANSLRAGETGSYEISVTSSR